MPLIDSAFQRQRHNRFDDETRVDIPRVIVGIGQGSRVGGAEKQPYGVEDGRLAYISAAENQIDALGRMP